MDKINKCLNNGFVPDCLFYNVNNDYNISIDMNKINYNNYYKSFEFFESKFPKGYDNITGFSEVIEDMAKNLKLSPLDEINEKLEN